MTSERSTMPALSLEFRHRPGPAPWLFGAVLVLFQFGCARVPSAETALEIVQRAAEGSWTQDFLRIATPWPPSARRKIEEEYNTWLSRSKLPGTVLVWIPTQPGIPLERSAGRPLIPRPPDVLLGGPVWEFVRLAGSESLETIEKDGTRKWIVARQSEIVLPAGSSEGSMGHVSGRSESAAFDDPRADPITLAWCLGQLEEGSWARGYSLLVRLFGHSKHRVGWRDGSAQGEVDQGESDRPLQRVEIGDPRPPIAADTRPVGVVEGAAIVWKTPELLHARNFLRFLIERSEPRIQSKDRQVPPLAIELCRDLLGATLVDSRDEMRFAWAAVEQAGNPPASLLAMSEPPPWPPISVQKILARGGEGGMTLLETLAAQIAPESSPRFWLIQSWLRPGRPIDGALLSELALAEEGRLAREPRFRAWLRAEWTAWGRQHYRRVARSASRGVPKPEVSSNAPVLH